MAAMAMGTLNKQKVSKANLNNNFTAFQCITLFSYISLL